MEVLSMSTTPWSECPITQRHRRIWNHQFGIHFKLGSETIAVLTRSVWRVEREVTRGRLFKTCVALWTREVLAKGECFTFLAVFTHKFYASDAVSKLEGCF